MYAGKGRIIGDEANQGIIVPEIHGLNGSIEELYGRSEPLFAPDIFQPYVPAFNQWCQINKERLKDRYSDEQLQEAAGLASLLYDLTRREYFGNRQDLFEQEDKRQNFLEEIKQLQNNVFKTGQIIGVSEGFAMSIGESINQCRRADIAFTERPDLQLVLNDWRYSYYTENTMASAANLLQFLDDTDMDRVYPEAMTHVTAGNAAIGHSVKNYILDRTRAGDTEYTITDIGSGFGATLAEIIAWLLVADKYLDREIKVNILSIDGCQRNYQILESKVVPAIKEKAEKMRNIRIDIRPVYGDIPEELKTADVRGTPIYTANYILDAFSDNVKKEILETMIGSAAENVALFVGDFGRNTSLKPNRTYFNLGMIGSINVGNDLDFMEQSMKDAGFTTIVTDEDLSQFKLPPVIENTCKNAKGEGLGFIIAGYKQQVDVPSCDKV